MSGEVIIILTLALLAALIGALVAGKIEGKTPQQETKKPNPADMECCGQHEVCEKESLLAAVSKEIEYYDDEELDRHKGKDSNAYTIEEEEEFRNILYTMKNEEVAGWVRSLQLRGIELPEGVKEEVLLIIRERRFGD